MNKKHLLIALAIILTPIFVFAQFTVPQGGTGRTTYPNGALFYFDGTRITATSSQPLYVGSIVATSTLLNIFPYATSTGFSTSYASSTNLHIGTGQGYAFVGSLGKVGVVSTSTLAGNLTASCSTITGSAGLCDGTDADTTYTAGDALTLTGNDFDFDGGTAPSGELGGTWGAITIDDSISVSSWNLTTPTFTTNFVFDAETFDSLTDDATLANNAGDLQVVDVTCTDCLGTTEIADSYLLNNGDVGTGVYDFGGATSFEITNGTSLTLNAIGILGLDTTANNLVIATSTTGSFVVASATTTLYSFSLSSTSPDFLTGGIIEMPSHPLQQVVTAVWCKADGGTSKQIFISDGTNDSNTITCTTTGTQYAVTSNNVFTAGEQIRTEFVTTSGSVDYVVVRWMGYRISD